MTLDAAAVRAFVERKRDGGAHSSADIETFVRAYADGHVADGPMGAWLMAVCLRGMDDDETAALTAAVARSGDVVEWGDTPHVVDKHSTGGVSDGVSLIAVPLAAACGARVAKLSGRALGHTGGTLDKLECIPGMRVDLSIDEFVAQVRRDGLAIAAAGPRLAPADKKMYALRDASGTVDSIPLIAASVLGKKIAAGAPSIVLDVKCGAGAFMRTRERADALAALMRSVGARLGRNVVTLVTPMDAPLGDAIGDALELDEALTTLEGRASGPLRDTALRVAAAMVSAALGVSDRDAAQRTAAALDDGSALRAFEKMVRAQGGRLAAFDRAFERSAPLPAERAGTVRAIDARVLGEYVAARKAGATGADRPRIGVRLAVRVGARVGAGDPLLWATAPTPLQPSALRAAFDIA